MPSSGRPILRTSVSAPTLGSPLHVERQKAFREELKTLQGLASKYAQEAVRTFPRGFEVPCFRGDMLRRYMGTMDPSNELKNSYLRMCLVRRNDIDLIKRTVLIGFSHGWECYRLSGTGFSP